MTHRIRLGWDTQPGYAHRAPTVLDGAMLLILALPLLVPVCLGGFAIAMDAVEHRLNRPRVLEADVDAAVARHTHAEGAD